MNSMLLTFGLLVSSGNLGATEADEWQYSGSQGPEHWGTLNPEFELCQAGKNQSPIDLNNLIEADLSSLEVAYQQGRVEIVHSGHTVQINLEPGSHMTHDGQQFELKQFHFHAPSEHRVNGKSYPLEAHLVHADGDSNLAVIGVLFEEGESHALLSELWTHAPRDASARPASATGIDAKTLLPDNQHYYRLNGSLTTPPCSEGVRWLVMKAPLTASGEQIEAFSELIGHANNRPLQAVNARPVLQ